MVWTGDDGTKHTKKFIVADRVIFVDLKNDEAEHTNLAEPQPDMVESEIPF